MATGSSLPVGDLELPYGCDLDAVGPALASRHCSLEDDAATRAWIAAAASRRAGRLRTWARRVLGSWRSDYDANALLQMHDMWLFSSRQLAALLEFPEGRVATGRLLDIGAGDGAVTAQMSPHFAEVVALETSVPMVRSLRRRGVHAMALDLAGDDVGALRGLGLFDAIALLNVIDRCARPETLLSRAAAALAPSGVLILAVPWPFSPHVHVGAETVSPEELLPIDDGDFEAMVGSIAERVVAPIDLVVRRWGRLPYLSVGDARRPIYALDDLVMVCGRAATENCDRAFGGSDHG